jgi:hypothetical protein
VLAVELYKDATLELSYLVKTSKLVDVPTCFSPLQDSANNKLLVIFVHPTLELYNKFTTLLYYFLIESEP